FLHSEFSLSPSIIKVLGIKFFVFKKWFSGTAYLHFIMLGFRLHLGIDSKENLSKLCDRLSTLNSKP
ncbi:MAG: hypothetical protein Q7U74_08950, partial [Saprospiraceae bacterium]|nr:hypothetical protein [Saprospiraceae bacterium]